MIMNDAIKIMVIEARNNISMLFDNTLHYENESDASMNYNSQAFI